MRFTALTCFVVCVLLFPVTGTIALGSSQLARISLAVTDSSGTPISSIGIDGTFNLEARVSDIREPALAMGVFSAYLDVQYDDTLALVDPARSTLVHSSEFPIRKRGELNVPGLIDGAGAVWDYIRLHFPSDPESERLLWRIENIQASAEGTLVFSAVPDLDLGNEVTLFGLNYVVPFDEIDYVGTSLLIIPEPTTVTLATFALVALIGFPRLFTRTGRFV